MNRDPQLTATMDNVFKKRLFYGGPINLLLHRLGSDAIISTRPLDV